MNLCFCFIKMDLFWFTYGFYHVIFSLLQPAEGGQCQSTTEFFRAQCGFWDNISFIWSYYSYGSNYVSSSCAGHGVCWFHWLILHFSEFGNMLIQIMVLCFALALMALLCWESYLVERMKECNILFLPVIHGNCFIMQIPEVLVHPYVNCLIVLINPVTYFGVCGIWCCPGAKDNFWVRQYSKAPWMLFFLSRIQGLYTWTGKQPQKLMQHLIEGYLDYAR